MTTTAMTNVKEGYMTAAGLRGTAKGGAAILLSAPCALAAFYILSYSVNVPYYDEWAMVDMVDRWLSMRGSWTDLFTPHNGHIIASHRLIILLNAYFFDWNIKVELFAGFLFLLATSAVLAFYCIRAGLFCRYTIGLPAAFAIMSILFSLRQWENFLAPWSIEPFGVAFFSISAFYLLSRSDGRRFPVSVMLAFFASITFTNGFLTWPIGAMILVIVADNDRRHWATWIAASALCIGLYVIRSGSVSHGAFPSTLAVLARGLVVIGSQLSADKAVVTGGATGQPSLAIDGAQAAILGLASLALTAWAIAVLYIRHVRLADYAFPLSLIVFGLASSALIAIGRADFGILQAISPRYTSTTGLVLVGLILLLAQLTVQGSSGDFKIGCILISLVLVSNSYSIFAELALGPARHQVMTTWAETVKQFATAPDAALKNPHYRPEQIRAFSATLEQHRLSVFAHSFKS